MNYTIEEIINNLIEVIWEILEEKKVQYDVIIVVLDEIDRVVLIQIILLDRKRRSKNVFFVVIIDGEVIEVFTSLQEAQTFFRNKIQEKRAMFLAHFNHQSK